jgi:hypothetical protein
MNDARARTPSRPAKSACRTRCTVDPRPCRPRCDRDRVGQRPGLQDSTCQGPDLCLVRHRPPLHTPRPESFMRDGSVVAEPDAWGWGRPVRLPCRPSGRHGKDRPVDPWMQPGSQRAAAARRPKLVPPRNRREAIRHGPTENPSAPGVAARSTGILKLRALQLPRSSTGDADGIAPGQIRPVMGIAARTPPRTSCRTSSTGTS